MSFEFVISLRSFYDSGLLVSNCSFHPHEPILACAVQHGTVRLYQQDVTAALGSVVPLSNWKETVLNPVSTQYPVSDASCLQWDADGRRLAVGYQNGTLILWSRDGCRLFERRKHTATIGSIRWNSIQLDIFASGSHDGSVVVWDAEKKHSPLVQRFSNDDRIHDVVWISGNQFAFYSRDQNDGIIRVFQIGRRHPVMEFVHGNSISSLRWSRQLNLLASVSSFIYINEMTHVSMLQIWSPNQIDPIKRLTQAQSEVRCIDWLNTEESDKLLFVVGGCTDGSIIVWNLNDDENSHQRLDDGHDVEINDISLSPNKRWLASIDRDGILIVRLVEDWRKVYETTTHASNCQSALSWSASSDKLAILNAGFEVFLVEIIH